MRALELTQRLVRGSARLSTALQGASETWGRDLVERMEQALARQLARAQAQQDLLGQRLGRVQSDEEQLEHRLGLLLSWTRTQVAAAVQDRVWQIDWLPRGWKRALVEVWLLGGDLVRPAVRLVQENALALQLEWTQRRRAQLERDLKQARVQEYTLERRLDRLRSESPLAAPGARRVC